MALPLRATDPRPKATVADGLQYLTALREELAGEPGKFVEVLAVIREFKSGSMDVQRVVARMEELLRGHTELLHEFNRFVPWSYIRAHGPAGGNIH